MPARKKKLIGPPLVVGIGASAGGTEALQALLGSLPAESGLSFIIVLHVDPAANALMPEVLSKNTQLPVVEAMHGMRVEPGHIYTTPGHHLIDIKDGVLQLRPFKKEVRHNPIDLFFYSLAEDQGERAVAVILSGTGSDGALGLKAVSKAGGMTLVQAPGTAKHEDMPQNAIDTGAADHVLSPQALAEELMAYADHMQFSGEKDEFELLRAQVASQMPNICEVLRQVTGHNFRHYKTSTLCRRIQRRIQVLRMLSAEDYLRLLRSDRVEVTHLFNDLLIGVTSFFRDPDAFKSLAQEVLPRLLKDRRPDDAVRIWVPGCATGEEAYTLAMLLTEQSEQMINPPDINIFATDIDEESLAIARQGVYPLTIAEEMTSERLARFFVKKGQNYHVSKALRSMVLFSVHNLINDPPFSKLDLISCRNLLIYLGSHLQKKLIPLFHYALKSGGYLFLGPSENLSSHRELFRPVDVKHRISQRLPTAARTTAPFPGRNGSPTTVKPPNAASASETDTYLVMQKIVLDEFAPKALVIDSQGQIICASGNLEKYMTVNAGAFQNSATRLVRDSLRVGLRAALSEAIRTCRQVSQDNLTLQTDEGVKRIMLTVQPMPNMGDEEELFLVVFRDGGLIASDVDIKAGVATEEAALLIEQLEKELLTTRDELERSVQDLEAANEEMKSSNEELLSMNEELQSANEELETSKEEVQTANDALMQVNTDLENLLASTQIATIFLDDARHVRRVTPSVSTIYNLMPTDIGRSLSHFTHNAVSMPPLPDLRTIRAARKPIESEIEMKDGSWYLRRVLPYHTSEGRTEGIVVTFTEVTDRKTYEKRLMASEKLYRAIGESIDYGVWVCDAEGRNTYASESFLKLIGATQEQCSGYGWTKLLHPDETRKTLTAWKECVRKGMPLWDREQRFKDADGRWRPILARGIPVRNDKGEITHWAGINLDINKLKQAEDALKEADQRKDEFLATLAHELRNPLAPLSNGLHVMRKALDKPDLLARALEVMERQTSHMVRLVDDLLDVSRITRGQIDLSKSRLNLASVVQTAVEISKPLINAKGHKLKVSLPRQPVYLVGDATRLSQVLANLLNNAAKYTPKNGQITLNAQKANQEGVITIRDNGIGIPKGKLDSIFDMFVQIDNALERSEGGLGIGLTLVRKLVELHGGSVGVTSKGKGKGSEFVVRLPLKTSLAGTRIRQAV